MGKKEQLIEQLTKLDLKKRVYGITTTTLQPHQIQLLPSIEEKILDGKSLSVPKYKYILYQGGNGSGKSFTGLYTTVLLALGDSTRKYGLPYIGSRKNIRIITKSGSNIEAVIMPYLTGDFSKTRIPPEEIKKIDNEKMIIYLENGTKIYLKTYDQGYERIQGGNPDFILVDEEPTKDKVWTEILARGRTKKCQILLTMTPLNGITPVYNFFYEQDNSETASRSKVFVVSSLQNEYADNSGLLGLTEQERKMRIEGMFVPPSGLVFPNFNRYNHVVEHFHPEILGRETRYYGTVDFGVVHPMAFLFISVDIDGNVYVFDEIYESGMLLADLVKTYREKKNKYGISKMEYITGDSAAKRERTELQQLGLKTVPADKFSKGENGDSNRRAGILKLNKLFYENKIFISSQCKNLIKELETHHYKEGGKKDGEVDKANDDAIDALRYWLFSYKPPKYITRREVEFKNKYGNSYNKISNKLYNNPY